MAQIHAGFDPTGGTTGQAVSGLAPRPETYRGSTLGIIDNTKPNAAVILSQLGDILKERYGFKEVRSYVKNYFGTPMTPDLLKQVAEECDVVVTAVGDCGSCSAATVADGIMLEREGIPAVSICTDSFVASAQAMAEVQGFPNYAFVTMAHPVASLDAEELQERVTTALPEVTKILAVAN